MSRALASVQQELGRRIRRERELKAMSQEALAYEAGITPSYVSQIETGKRNPSVAALHGMCRALGLSLSQLFSGL
jgi:transcriptional regulator with XRE-family HTH domain